MKKARMQMNNARDKEQLERMQQLQKGNKCFFCDKNYIWTGASPEIYESQQWYIKKNDYPYKGSVHHYLIANKSHITQLSGISEEGWLNLSKCIKWLEKKLGVKGYSVFVRSGDMRYTGGTIDHIHFHFLVGGIKDGSSNLKNNLLVTLGHKKK